METFTLTIELGNEAMQTSEDVAAALDVVAAHLHEAGTSSVFGGPIRDLNGNTVGRYQCESA